MRGFQREGEKKKEIRGMWFEISGTTWWYAGIFIIT